MTPIIKLNIGWSSGKDEISVVALEFDGAYIIQTVHEHIGAVWKYGAIPTYRKDKSILPLYKGK